MLEIDVLTHLHEVPVVEPRPPYAVLVDAKTELSDEVQHRPRRRCEARDVSRVGRDLGLHEDDVKGSRHGRGAEA